MSINKILATVLLAVAMPFATQADAAKPHRKTTKSRSHRTVSAKRKTSAQNFMSLQAYNEAIEAKTNTAAIANSDDVSGETIVKTAMQYIGVPYRHGTSSPKSFDCSGFTSFVYRQFDINLSRDSRAQYTQGQIIKNKSDLRAGDLVFFQGSSGRGGVGHVGIVTEVNPSDMTFKFVHASSKKGVTTEQSTTAYYNQRYVGARRVLQNIDE